VSRAAMTGTDPAAVGELLAGALQQTFGEVT
jgi:hypothetical protein